LGSFEITALAIGIIALFVFKKEKKIFWGLIFFGAILVFEMIGKLGVYHPGPPNDLFRYTLPFSFPTSYVSTAGSFPSGHVSRTAFLAVMLIVIFFRRRSSKIMVAVFLLAMVLSRIYLGEHWASDTIGGLLLGGSMAFGFSAVTWISLWPRVSERGALFILLFFLHFLGGNQQS